MKKIALALVLALGASAAWFFVSPLFIDVTIDEEFDFVGNDGRLDMNSIMAMPDSRRMEMKDEIMRLAAAAPGRAVVDPMMNAARASLLASGSFVDADAIHKGAGTASLYELGDGGYLVRFEDFRTTNGPALVVYLARHVSPASAADVTDGGFVKLGKLKGNVGNQNYRVPGGTEIDQFNSVVVWCELFGVLFSPAASSRN